MWMPRLACPECRHPLPAAEVIACLCGRRYGQDAGTWCLLDETRRQQAHDCAAQYRTVRHADGHRDVTRAWWHLLPDVPDPRHPSASEWRIRRESLQQLMQALPQHAGPRLLDLGSGSGWMAARFAAAGYDVVALDRFDDEFDHEVIRRHRASAFVTVCADFEALPLEPGQFDVVVFNAALHYARDPESALARAADMLAPGGVLAVVDSPMFAQAVDGEAMVAGNLAALATAYGIDAPVRLGAGYVTFEGLERVAERLGLRTRFIASRGPLSWRLRRAVAPLRLGRAPAAFGVWIAQ